MLLITAAAAAMTGKQKSELTKICMETKINVHANADTKLTTMTGNKFLDFWIWEFLDFWMFGLFEQLFEQLFE